VAYDRCMDAVETQVQAYNSHDLEAFVSCYAEDVVVEDGDGNVLIRGRAGMRERYGRLFSESPSVQAEIPTRIRLGRYVVDEEHVTGRSGGDLHAVVVYRLDDDGLIDRVLFLR
jgi:hypothetical protein